VTVKASMPMRASKAKAESAASRAERVEAESAEGVEAAVVVPAASLSAAHATTVETVEAVVATADPPGEAPKKRGRGRPKKVRTEAEQRLVDLKTKKKAAPETSSGKENDKENAGAVAGFSLKSLIVAAGAPKKRPVLGLADANATPSAKEKGVPAKTKRRRLANVSSLRDVIGSPLENGRFLR
jgi:transposase